MDDPTRPTPTVAGSRPAAEFTSRPDGGHGGAGPGRGTRVRRSLPAALSVVILVVASAAVVVRTADRADAVVFRYAGTPGETRTYDVSMHMDVRPVGQTPTQAASGSMDGTMTWTVREVREDGSMVVDLSVHVVSSTLPPGALDGSGGTMTAVVSPTGRVLSVEGSTGLLAPAMAVPLPGAGGDRSGPGSSQLFFPRFPSDPIGPGDEWTDTDEIPFPLPDGQTRATPVTTTGAHDGFEQTAYGRAARIRQTVAVPLDLELPLGPLVGAFAGAAGGSGPDVPPGIDGARMVVRGEMDMTASSLVIPSTSDLVRLDGEMDMAIGLSFEGFPDVPAEGIDGSGFSMQATMRLQVERTA